jgi:plasmid replication initiation protein
VYLGLLIKDMPPTAVIEARRVLGQAILKAKGKLNRLTNAGQTDGQDYKRLKQEISRLQTTQASLCLREQTFCKQQPLTISPEK